MIIINFLGPSLQEAVDAMFEDITGISNVQQKHIACNFFKYPVHTCNLMISNNRISNKFKLYSKQEIFIF